MFTSYPSLFPEMRMEIRSHCTPSTRSMLTLTCKDERAAGTNDDRTTLLVRLAAEGDEEGHLKRYITAIVATLHKHTLLTDYFAPILKAAIRAERFSVLDWLVAFQPYWMTRRITRKSMKRRVDAVVEYAWPLYWEEVRRAPWIRPSLQHAGMSQDISRYPNKVLARKLLLAAFDDVKNHPHTKSLVELMEEDLCALSDTITE